MNAEEVCLRWSNFSLNITKNIDELWKDESLVDVTICSEGQSIQAHKIILSASSPLFKGIFAVNPCQHPVVILQDVKYRELSSIISFIYKGEVNIDQQYLPELLKAAQTLQIRGLSDSVGTLNNDECLPLKSEHSAKKRKVNTTSNSENEEKEELFHEAIDIIPKQEMETNEFIPPDIETHMSDEEDIKDIKLEGSIGENSQLLVVPPDNHGFYMSNPFGMSENVSRDRDSHFPMRVDKRRRCRICSLSKVRTCTWYVCTACRDNKNQVIGLCPDPCFALFHKSFTVPFKSSS